MRRKKNEKDEERKIGEKKKILTDTKLSGKNVSTGQGTYLRPPELTFASFQPVSKSKK